MLGSFSVGISMILVLQNVVVPFGIGVRQCLFDKGNPFLSFPGWKKLAARNHSGNRTISGSGGVGCF